MASYRAKLPVIASGGVVIKSVQRGQTTIPINQATVNVTINAVDMSKTFVVCEVTAQYTGAEEEGQTTASVHLASSTQISVRRVAGSSTQAVYVTWQVIEFVSGVSVQRGFTSTTSASTTVTISAVDMSKSVLLSSIRYGGSTGILSLKWTGVLTSSTSIAYSAPTTTGATANIHWEVVSYV